MSISFPQLKKQIDTAAEYFGFPKIQFEVLADAPLTFLISQPTENRVTDLAPCLTFLAGKALKRDIDEPSLLFRGVEIDRLETIVRTGCDVVPSDSPFYAACLEKALEYGGYNKVVQVFDPQKLDRTFVKVGKSETVERLEELRAAYPSCKDLGGEWFWFSKLPPGDFRIGTAYEMEYSFFIPRNPLDALLMVFLVGNDSHTLQSTWRNLRSTLSKPSCANLEAAKR